MWGWLAGLFPEEPEPFWLKNSSGKMFGTTSRAKEKPYQTTLDVKA
jgi:hypothetical protein